MSDYEDDDDFADDTPQRENAGPKVNFNNQKTMNAKAPSMGNKLRSAGLKVVEQKKHNQDMVAGSAATMMGMAQKTTGKRQRDLDAGANNDQASPDQG